MYNEYRFGRFSYGNKRIETEPLLMKFLALAGDSGGTLFDIGCGSGFWTETYLKYGINKNKITLLDLAPANIEELKKDNFNAICGSVLELPFENNVSDFTVCNGVIHHTPDPEKAFSELVRITRPGKFIYLNVYNKWHPYYYIVHKATFPIRYLYWNYNKKILDFIYPIVKIFFQQPLAYICFGEFLDDCTAKTIFMDQIMTPRASLFSIADIKRFAKENNCNIEQLGYNKLYSMIAAIIKVNKLK